MNASPFDFARLFAWMLAASLVSGSIACDAETPPREAVSTPDSLPLPGSAPSVSATPSQIDGLAPPLAPAMTPNAAGDYDFRIATLKIPADWESQPPSSSMRLAEFVLSGADGAGDATAAVFYFPPGEGGSLEANIERWIGQVRQPDGAPSQDAAQVAQMDKGAMKIATLDISGTMAPTMGAPPEENQRMFCVAAESPDGVLAIRIVGPETTMDAHEAQLQALADGLTPK